jgi:TonB family protein
VILTFALALLLLNGQMPSPLANLPSDEPISTPVLHYPEDARKARIQGTVDLQVEVDITGHVTAVQALAGPVALRPAAVDAYTHAAYRPLIKNGHPIPATIRTSVTFTLKELPPDTDQQVDLLFEPQHRRCQQLSADLTAASPAAERDTALSSCRQAVDTARRFTPTAQLELRATALNDLVLLLIAPGKASKQLPEAAALADEAIALVAAASPHVPAVAIAHITRAEVRSLAGDLRGAAQDCAAAEEVFTTLLADERENERAGGYRGQLRETLLLHAIVLERDHHPFEARRLRHRAAAI